jgi:hypothetical protein
VGSSTNGARLRAWFLRNLLDAAERELGAAAVASLPERVSARVRGHLSLDRLRASVALDTIPLDEGEDAILAFENTLGDGSGRTLERVACEMLARQLVQAASAVRVGDLFGTVARLRAPLEHPFVDAPVLFELTRTGTGFQLTIGMAGRPRSTRLLGHLATGAIHAAERFARESHTDPLRLDVATFADRARIDAHFRRASSAPPAPDPVPAPRRSCGTSRLLPSLSDEVARILDSSLPGGSRFSSEEPPSRRSDRPSGGLAKGSTPPESRPASETPRVAGTERRSSRPPPGR